MSLKRALISVINLGIIRYRAAVTVQKEAVNRIHKELQTQQTVSNRLFLLEHYPVYTEGIRSGRYKEDEQRLKSLGCDFVTSDRGGLITFHGPGQLVAYPVLYLGSLDNKKSVRGYVCRLEQVLIDTCASLGIVAARTEHTGVWVGDNKIAAIGIHASRYVVSHGVALNCNVDLSYFDHIVPCGISGKGVTSLSRELSRDVGVAEVAPLFVDRFANVFNCDVTYQEYVHQASSPQLLSDTVVK